jgi:hypothetical protein
MTSYPTLRILDAASPPDDAFPRSLRMAYSSKTTGMATNGSVRFKTKDAPGEPLEREAE